MLTDNLSPAKIRERADRPQTLVCFSNEEAHVVATAIEIADESAWAHVEGETPSLDDGWRDLSFVGGGWPQGSRFRVAIKSSVDKSLAYLTDRGLIERHPEQPWVRIKERAE